MNKKCWVPYCKYFNGEKDKVYTDDQIIQRYILPAYAAGWIPVAAKTAAAVADKGSCWCVTGLGVPGHPVAADAAHAASAAAFWFVSVVIGWVDWAVPFTKYQTQLIKT